MNLRSHWIAVVAVALLFCASIQTDAQDPRETMYVKVDTTSPDAVVQSSTDFFGSEPLGRLVSNQPVEMLRETDGDFVKIRCEIEGKAVAGWVKRSILQSKPLGNMVRENDSGSDDKWATWTTNGRRPIEDHLRYESPNMATGLERITEFEEFLASEFGTDRHVPNPEPGIQKFREFAVQGGLEPGSMK